MTCRLQQMLEAMAMMEYCRAVGRAGTSDFDLGAILGECDWHEEFCRLMNGGELNETKIYGTSSKETRKGIKKRF